MHVHVCGSTCACVSGCGSVLVFLMFAWCCVWRCVCGVVCGFVLVGAVYGAVYRCVCVLGVVCLDMRMCAMCVCHACVYLLRLLQKSEVSAAKTVWISLAISLVVFLSLGIFGAMAMDFKHGVDLLAAIDSPTSHTKVCFGCVFSDAKRVGVGSFYRGWAGACV